ncbi:Uncharacterised protein [uncultured archaeon]|nr:Uncharacterised protein [uncultured archaeon]
MVRESPNPVYVKLEYNESLESKKDLLSSEISFLNLIKIMRRYNALRQEEFLIKLKIDRSLKALDLAVKKTKSTFPFLKIPKQARREEINKKEIVTINKESFDRDLESQLRDIQERLISIGR